MKKRISSGKAHSFLPKMKRPNYWKRKREKAKWLLPFLGLLSMMWFLVRVIPKPSRATYPCQRAALPMASSSLVWLIGAIASVAAVRKVRYSFVRSRYLIGVICIAVSIGAALMAIGGGNENIALADNTTPNDPIGIARGVHPGRVVWVHDPDATDWDGPDMGDGHWWESTNIDMAVVDQMMSRAICALAGESNSIEAWDKIFRYFNQTHGKGDVGYQPGERIAIKINLTTCNASYGPDKGTREKTTYLDKAGDTSPQMILSLLRQLVNVVGVEQTDISVGDTVSYFPTQWHDHITPEFPNIHYLDHYAFPGRTQVRHSTTPFYWSTSEANGKVQDYLPVSFVEAIYIINFAVLKGHGAGITVCAKNHYGSLIRNPVGHEWGVKKDYYNLHDSLPCDWARPGIGYYRALVDLMGHAELGGKTVLHLIDGLYGGYYWEGTPYKWNMLPFDDNWPSSLFASQDPVAIDSVAYDFLHEEWPNVVEDGNGDPGSLEGGAEDYLHEAALANDPPSGTFYDPENDGTVMDSLGVHEHWNNPTDKQYSRNLGTGDGIELISLDQSVCTDSPAINDMVFDSCISELCTSAITVNATDLCGGNLMYDWTALNGGVVNGSGTSVVFDPPDTGPHLCPHQVKVTVTSSVSGLSTSQTIDIYVKLAGDVDGNGVINVLDKVQVRNHFGESGDPGFVDADVDCNGVVNVLDKVKVTNQFGQNGCLCP